MPRLEQPALRISKENYNRTKKENAFQKNEGGNRLRPTRDHLPFPFLLNYFGEKNKPRCGIVMFVWRQKQLELSELQTKEYHIWKYSKIVQSGKITLSDLADKSDAIKRNDVIKIAHI